MSPPEHTPKVLIPYPGPTIDPGVQDIFLYLRPEANGVQVESILLKVIERSPEYKKRIFLRYLANFPGKYILDNHIVERHYELKFYFAVKGKTLFTPYMQERFEEYFRESFESAPIVGSFPALRVLQLSPDELFSTWVPPEQMLVVSGQNIKRIQGYFIVNYDLPAIMHKNNRDTDIAVMLFRTDLGYGYFNELVEQMKEDLDKAQLTSLRIPPSRLFHISKGPFEQVLDGLGYLYGAGPGRARPEDLSFAVYLHRNGIDYNETLRLLKNPIGIFRQNGVSLEEDILVHTQFDTYPGALEKLRSMEAQHYLLRQR
jgi:hypothetical protein